MTEDLSFRTDLYRGTAPFYDRFRPPYPPALFEDLRTRLPISGAGRLLDLGCGTGQITFPLAGEFASVLAVDREEETVAFGRTKAEHLGILNTAWVTGDAETVEAEGPFELVAMGNAFHRMDRPAVAERAARAWLTPGGGVALLWGGLPSSGGLPWQRALEAGMADWMTRFGTMERIPAGLQCSIDALPHSEVLTDAGLDYVGKFEFTTEETWSLESLAGFMYSTSILSKAALGDQVDAFERELADQLLPFAPDGVFRLVGEYAYELAVLP